MKDVKTKKMQITNSIPISIKNAVECKLPILEEEVQNVIKLDAKAVINQAVLLENEIRYDGNVIFTALISDNNLKKCEMGVDFSYKSELKGARENGDVLVGIECENVRAQLVNGIPVATCTLALVGEGLVKEETEFLSDASDVQIKKLQTENACVLETIEKTFDLEDEFDLDYTVTEVLWHIENVKPLEITSNIGAVSISGEVELCYLALNSEYKPVIDRKIIPFVYEADAKSAMPELIAEGTVLVKGVNLKVFVDESKNKSTVSVIMKMGINASVIENQLITYIDDAFSKDCYLTLDKKTINTSKCLGEKLIEKAVNFKLSSEFEKTTLLICPLFAKIEDIEVTRKDETFFVNGACQVGMLLSVQGGYAVQTSLIPFETSFVASGDTASITSKTICDLSISQAGSQLTIDFTLRLRVKETAYSSFNAVSLIEEGEQRVKSNSAISVYIPKNGDTLWDVCKSIGIDEDEILKVNPDLAFPTSGEERIIIYREIK